MTVGSFMLCFGLFMLSLAKPDQYYQVCLSIYLPAPTS